MTPVQQLNLRPQVLEVPESFVRFLPNRPVVYLPEGFRAKVYYAGLELGKPRFLAWGPDSTVFVTDLRGGIFSLPDRNRDGQADELFRVADNIFAHDIKFFRGKLYAAEERRVLELEDRDGDGRYETRRVFIDGIAEGSTQPGGGHRTRTIVFDTLSQKLYLSIGSFCNVCREDQRAIIEAYDLDGTNRRIYATGVRNAVGMSLQPSTNRLWATNNGSDNQGDDVPTEWVDLIRDGGFYGYPFAYGDGLYFDFSRPQYRDLLPLTSADSQQVASMVPPAALIQAHSAPMAIEFLPADWPEPFAGGALVALRGSWNRSIATGHKIIFLNIDSDRDTTVSSVADWMTGFLTDSVRSQRWARPVGLLAGPKGSLYLTSDDIHPFILKVEYISPNRRTGQKRFDLPYRLVPKPNENYLVLDWRNLESQAPPVEVYIQGLDGRTLYHYRVSTAPYSKLAFSAPPGVYVARIQTSAGACFWQRYVWLL